MTIKTEISKLNRYFKNKPNLGLLIAFLVLWPVIVLVEDDSYINFFKAIIYELIFVSNIYIFIFFFEMVFQKVKRKVVGLFVGLLISVFFSALYLQYFNDNKLLLVHLISLFFVGAIFLTSK